MPIQRSLSGHLLILGTILFTVYGQLVIKWQVERIGPLSLSGGGPVRFFLAVVMNPWIVSGLASAFVAFLCWAGAVSKLPLSYAYPFTSLSFVLVVLLSATLFGEAVTPQRVAGLVLILVGLYVGSRA
jgi:multidrug transporter EmrE-like cation transporter